MPRFVPKSVVCWREGYTRAQVMRDVFAGITVGIIALPLAVAFGIASIPEAVATAEGISPPAAGLYTAVVAGIIVAVFGGSRVQIAGPTGAFIVIVYDIAARHGFAGLATATLMAGVIIVIMGLARFGAMIKFIPYPVTTGFTTGIAVIIFSSQLRDFLGLRMGEVPAEFIEKWRAYAEHLSTFDSNTLWVGGGSLLLLMFVQRFVKRLPPAIVTVVVATAVVWILNIPVETVGSRFGELPRTLPTPHMPGFSFELARELIPEAMTIAMLAAIESLLSAVVADGMIGGRHKADCELVAQGLANIGSVIFGGIPATGAIARTVANIKNGGRTPLSAGVHSVTLIVVMAVAAPLASHIPLATLAAVLMLVAYNMSELDHFRSILRAPGSDVAVLLATFFLTVFTDLTIAVGVGVVLASLLFMKRMAEVSSISEITDELADGDMQDDPDATSKKDVPDAVEVYEINGPLFFGIADRLKDVLRQMERPPRIFILRMRKVPSIDATGLHALREFHWKCQRQGTTLVLSGVQPQPREAIEKSGLLEQIGEYNVTTHIDLALERARVLLGLSTV
ncbi:MAG TPA: sulfate permease [Candidatus Hydrogenedentes bacterium]|nr:sulfate permease [Candidatus Hydrogenedentota bacterium]HRK34679.1 sulfate permease [Candidatus Hydrogenedentota bacterium]